MDFDYLIYFFFVQTNPGKSHANYSSIYLYGKLIWGKTSLDQVYPQQAEKANAEMKFGVVVCWSWSLGEERRLLHCGFCCFWLYVNLQSFFGWILLCRKSCLVKLDFTKLVSLTIIDDWKHSLLSLLLLLFFKNSFSCLSHILCPEHLYMASRKKGELRRALHGIQLFNIFLLS